MVTIEGSDFRNTMDGYPGERLKVYFGDGVDQVPVPSSDIISVVSNKIEIKTPPYKPGLATIKVENPDGNIVELVDAFTYISSPLITKVVEPDNEEKEIQSLSAEGGQKIKLIGRDFMPGARVIFNPVIKKVEDKEEEGEIININGESYILQSGNPGTNIEVVDAQRLIVTTPSGALDTGGILVINEDKGATPIYQIKYVIPEVGEPTEVIAELISDQYIRVNWTGVPGALEYEIYVSVDYGEFEYVGSTKTLGYVYQNIESRTRYQFMVRAIGTYGPSKPLETSKSNIVRTTSKSGPTDYDDEIGEYTQEEKTGDIANVIFGHRDYHKKDHTIDLTKGVLANSKEVIISIPASIIADDNRKNITVIGKDYSLSFRPNIFNNSTFRNYKNRDDVGVRIKVSPYESNVNNNGLTPLSTIYSITGQMYIGADYTSLDYLNGNIFFQLDYDEYKANLRKLTNIYLSRYDRYGNNWIDTRDISRLGIYAIMGSRR